MFGRQIPTPRWQQAYGRDYRYSGSVNRALPLPPALAPLLEWARSRCDPRLNSALVNWYDRASGHYIGRHRDAETGRVPGSEIVAISLGHRAVLRLRPAKGRGFSDIPLADGDVYRIPWETNRAFTHEIPPLKTESHGLETGNPGRRISVTFRAFVGLAGRSGGPR